MKAVLVLLILGAALVAFLAWAKTGAPSTWCTATSVTVCATVHPPTTRSPRP